MMESFKELQKTLDAMIKETPCDWQLIARDLSESDFSMLRVWVQHRLNHLNRLAMYIDKRGGNGCGDCGHDEALDSTRF